jgi:hypothetical protein
MSDEFYEWLKQGIEAGWVSDVVCDTHEGLPQTDAEQDEWEEGGDPCIHGIRVWIDGGK